MNRRQRQRLILGLLLLIILATWGARVWQLGSVPPGWSDDELSDVLVIAQKLPQGDYAVYYNDATGLEALYFVISGLFLRLFGFNAIGIRLLSALLGTLTVPLTYQVGRRLWRSPWVGLLAAAALAVSFWSLIYSRFSLRHIAMPVLMLLAFAFFWRGLQTRLAPRAGAAGWAQWWPFALAGISLGVGFYTYFAARGVPLILLAFCGYLALCHRPLFRRHWPGFLLMFLLAGLLALPLLATLAGQTGADARVSEVAVPLTEALAGDYTRLQQHVVTTLSMFHADGDDEFLYNIPHRPVFGPAGAVVFWLGWLLALWYALRPWLRRPATPRSQADQRAATFLLLWWLAGITPGFLSIPAGSLGHTIVAQPATYLLLALPLLPLSRWRLAGRARTNQALAGLLALLVLGSVAGRDLGDYFRAWPAQGNVRFLYRADIRDVAGYLQAHPELTDVGMTGLLAGPWDRLALEIDLGHNPLADDPAGLPVQVRWYNPQRALLWQLAGQPALVWQGYPVVETIYDAQIQPIPGATAGGYQLAQVVGRPAGLAETPVCFANGLCWLGATYDPAGGYVDVVWQVARPLDLPAMPLVSKPPPPGVYDGPRLAVFAQLVDAGGQFLVGDDGLWVDPQTLRPGDIFQQRHWLAVPAGATPSAILIGLYDPLTGQRVPGEDGQAYVRLPLSE